MNIQLIAGVLNYLTENTWIVLLGVSVWTLLVALYVERKIHFSARKKELVEDVNKRSMRRADELLHQAKCVSISRVRVALNKMSAKISNCNTTKEYCSQLNDSHKLLESLMLSTLNSTLSLRIRSSLEYKVYKNGYHSKEGADLQEYIRKHARIFRCTP